MKIMRDHLTPEGQEEYADYPEQVRSVIFDLKQQKVQIPVELEENSIYQVELRCLDSNGNKMVTREMPAMGCFPNYVKHKESKMYLTQLETPDNDLVEELKDRLRTVIREYGPREISIPAGEAVTSLSSSKYSDGHYPRSDYEKPESTWHYSWTYQHFKTDPTTEREVWLPPKSYKIASSWWHFFTEPINSRIPWLVCNDTLTETRKDLHKRFEPVKTIDLKGFGLQFPREYIMATIDVLKEIYPASELDEYERLTAFLFKNLSVKMEDDTFIVPKRGVGLGYFSNIMTLVVGALLSEFKIVKMFNDDILCPSTTYDEAVAKLIRFKFIINEKKSGREYKKAPYFAGASMARNGSLHYFDVQGQRAAVFTKRYHYERKQIILSTTWRYRWKINYHYERIFGYEYQKCDTFEHPNKLGLDISAEKPVGYVKGGLLKEVMVPKPDVNEEERRVWSIKYPWKTPTKSKNFGRYRKEFIQKYKHHIHYTEYDEYLNPDIKMRVTEQSHPDFFLGSYQLPRWADLESLIRTGYTCGRTTKGRHPKRAAHYMLNHLLATDPINSWVSGGYDIISPFYRIPAPTLEVQLLYDRLKSCSRMASPIAIKRRGKDSYASTDGQGLKFLESIEVTTDQEYKIIETTLENIPEYLHYSDSDSLTNYESEEDYGVLYESDSESSLGILGDDEW
jgi:hypothetical protein